jgi:hypothetical protein
VNWSILALVDSLHYTWLNGLFLICFVPECIIVSCILLTTLFLPVLVVSIVLYGADCMSGMDI